VRDLNLGLLGYWFYIFTELKVISVGSCRISADFTTLEIFLNDVKI